MRLVGFAQHVRKGEGRKEGKDGVRHLNVKKISSHNLIKNIINLREKNSRLDQDSNPGLQLYVLALKPLSYPYDPLGQPRILLLLNPHYPPGSASAMMEVNT